MAAVGGTHGVNRALAARGARIDGCALCARRRGRACRTTQAHQYAAVDEKRVLVAVKTFLGRRCAAGKHLPAVDGNRAVGVDSIIARGVAVDIAAVDHNRRCGIQGIVVRRGLNRAAFDGQRLLALQALTAVGRGGEDKMSVHHVHVALAANGFRVAARAARACARSRTVAARSLPAAPAAGCAAGGRAANLAARSLHRDLRCALCRADGEQAVGRDALAARAAAREVDGAAEQVECAVGLDARGVARVARARGIGIGLPIAAKRTRHGAARDVQVEVGREAFARCARVGDADVAARHVEHAVALNGGAVRRFAIHHRHAARAVKRERAAVDVQGAFAFQPFRLVGVKLDGERAARNGHGAVALHGLCVGRADGRVHRAARDKERALAFDTVAPGVGYGERAARLRVVVVGMYAVARGAEHVERAAFKADVVVAANGVLVKSRHAQRAGAGKDDLPFAENRAFHVLRAVGSIGCGIGERGGRAFGQVNGRFLLALNVQRGSVGRGDA